MLLFNYDLTLIESADVKKYVNVKIEKP